MIKNCLFKAILRFLCYYFHMFRLRFPLGIAGIVGIILLTSTYVVAFGSGNNMFFSTLPWVAFLIAIMILWFAIASFSFQKGTAVVILPTLALFCLLFLSSFIAWPFGGIRATDMLGYAFFQRIPWTIPIFWQLIFMSGLYLYRPNVKHLLPRDLLQWAFDASLYTSVILFLLVAPLFSAGAFLPADPSNVSIATIQCIIGSFLCTIVACAVHLSLSLSLPSPIVQRTILFISCLLLLFSTALGFRVGSPIVGLLCIIMIAVTMHRMKRIRS